MNDAVIADRQKDKDAIAKFLTGIETYLVMHPVVYVEFLNGPADVLDRIEIDTVLEFGMLAKFGDMLAVISVQGDDQENIYEVKVAPSDQIGRLGLHAVAGKVLGVRRVSVDEICQRLLAQPSKRTREPVAQKTFHVCQCEPPPEACMCHWCHTCHGVKPEYAEKYRKSPWYVEVSLPSGTTP
jgi:hypothetical protein